MSLRFFLFTDKFTRVRYVRYVRSGRLQMLRCGRLHQIHAALDALVAALLHQAPYRAQTQRLEDWNFVHFIETFLRALILLLKRPEGLVARVIDLMLHAHDALHLEVAAHKITVRTHLAVGGPACG